ncbi:radial spoke head protein 6 homolog A-like [Denticeps clupeoides]|uniref:radial spoke head protein 6 homolog A-like n=1 Tax=Denticeps clupeoides TaxID=299321 RepID=UPI0010A4BEEA|nr:radial spoke head protein 6 homolog A-like [Denticeps clupeoides]XP_028822273.1 radial spoke head protein 6 homolog A-like [Denticeps clupeoides]XP_028822763.1 radial spoke head protein 6 homolog A-like [Denticeps clupeoides]
MKMKRRSRNGRKDPPSSPRCLKTQKSTGCHRGAPGCPPPSSPASPWPSPVITASRSPRRKFENVYIGWGVKSDAAFSPALPPDPQRDFPGGPEVTEEADPTPQEDEDED